MKTSFLIQILMIPRIFLALTFIPISASFATLVSLPTQVSWALSPPEVSDVAKRITVRIEGNSPGTGVIVSQQGNTYTVLTNTHVLQRRKNYAIQTFDGKTYLAINRHTQHLPGVDLSLIEFSSSQSYEIAEIGNSDLLNEGMTLYIGGWAATDQVNRERGYRFSEGRLSGRATNPEKGYALIYSNPVKPGMSGSPVLNEEGQLVGINGKAVTDIRTGEIDYYGIPINIYLQLAKKSNATGENASYRSDTLSSAAKIPPFSRSPEAAPQPKPLEVNNNSQPGTTGDRLLPNFSIAATLTGHSHSIYAVAYSLDNKTLASGSYDKTIKIWNASTPQEISTLLGHQDSVSSLAYSPNSQMLASGSADRTVKIWDLTAGKEIRTLQGHTDTVSSVAYSLDGENVASGSWDKTVKLWDVTTGQEIYTLVGHADAVDAIAYSPDGKTLASGSWDKTIKIWDLTTGKEIHILSGHTQAIDTLAYSLDGKTLASGSGDKTIKIWDVTTGTEIRTLTGHDGTVDALAYSPDGKTLASGSGDKTIKIWDITAGTEIRTLRGAKDTVYSLAYSPDGQKLASGSSNVNLVGDKLEFAGGNLAIWQLSKWQSTPK